MNTKFSVKQLILMSIIAIALIIPWFSKYLNLDLNWKFKVLGIFAISLIILWVCVVLLVWDYTKNNKNEQEEWTKEEKEINSNIDNAKNVVINHNYEKVHQKYQWWYSKYGNAKKYVDNSKFVKLTISDKNKIQIIHRLTELKNESFEYFIWFLFKFHGYTINRWPMYYKGKPLPDGWKDLIMSKDNQIYVVQIKKYINKFVPVDDIRIFNWALEKDEKWIFVTTSVSSEGYPENECNEKWIIWKDYKDIWDMLNELSEDNKKYLEENYINNVKNLDKYKVKTCKSCWAPFIKWKNWYFCWNTYNWCNSTGYIQ